MASIQPRKIIYLCACSCIQPEPLYLFYNFVIRFGPQTLVSNQASYLQHHTLVSCLASDPASYLKHHTSSIIPWSHAWHQTRHHTSSIIPRSHAQHQTRHQTPSLIPSHQTLGIIPKHRAYILVLDQIYTQDSALSKFTSTIHCPLGPYTRYTFTPNPKV